MWCQIKHTDYNDDDQAVLPDSEKKTHKKAVGVTRYYAKTLENKSLMDLSDLETT